ncbi:hypothetical protein ABZ357_35360 [Streptomyces sp. NPDC005917]|uniref:hypothetical protein n=1 Tax=unclassified Streptomyces TaxID=2593676 RepID=UPI0033ECBA3D
MLAQATTFAAPDSALDALLIVAAVVLGLAYCLFMIASPVFAFGATIFVALSFAVGYFPAVAFGASKPISTAIGAIVAGVACLVAFLILRKHAREDEREMQAQREELERQARAPRNMRDYWDMGE